MDSICRNGMVSAAGICPFKPTLNNLSSLFEKANEKPTINMSGNKIPEEAVFITNEFHVSGLCHGYKLFHNDFLTTSKMFQ